MSLIDRSVRHFALATDCRVPKDVMVSRSMRHTCLPYYLHYQNRKTASSPWSYAAEEPFRRNTQNGESHEHIASHDMTNIGGIRKVSSDSGRCLKYERKKKALLSLLNVQSSREPLMRLHFNSLFCYSRNMKDPGMARYLYLRMRESGLYPDIEEFMHIIEVHTDSGDLCNAFNIYRKMEKEGINANIRIFNALLDCMVAKGCISSAWRFYTYVRCWRCIKPDEKMLSIMIKACVKSQNADRAMDIYTEMLDYNLTPKDSTYEDLIVCFSQREEYAYKCIQMYDMLIARGTRRTMRMLSSAIKACEISGNTRKARELIKEAKLCGISMDNEFQVDKVDSMKRISSGHNALSMLISQLNTEASVKALTAKTLAVEHERECYDGFAVDTLHNIFWSKCTPEDEKYSSLIKILVKHRKEPEKFLTLWDMTKNIISPNGELLNMVLEVSLRLKSLRRILEVLSRMYVLKIFPIPEVIGKLYMVAKEEPRIHIMVQKLISLERQTSLQKAKKESHLLDTYVEEMVLRSQ